MAGLVEALVGGVQGAASAGSMIAMEKLKDNALKLREERNAALKDRYATKRLEAERGMREEDRKIARTERKEDLAGAREIKLVDDKIARGIKLEDDELAFKRREIVRMHNDEMSLKKWTSAQKESRIANAKAKEDLLRKGPLLAMEGYVAAFGEEGRKIYKEKLTATSTAKKQEIATKLFKIRLAQAHPMGDATDEQATVIWDWAWKEIVGVEKGAKGGGGEFDSLFGRVGEHDEIREEGGGGLAKPTTGSSAQDLSATDKETIRSEMWINKNDIDKMVEGVAIIGKDPAIIMRNMESIGKALGLAGATIKKALQVYSKIKSPTPSSFQPGSGGESLLNPL